MINIKGLGNFYLMMAVCFLMTASVIGFNQNITYAAETSANIGVVNYQLLVSQHPDMAAVKQAMEDALKQAQSDFDAKSANLNDQDKQVLYQQMQQELNQKKIELMKPINDKILAAIQSVVKAKGLVMVVTQDAVVFGGQDITDDVGKIIAGK